MDNKSILVIDDEQAIVHVIKLHLEKKGYRVSSANDGEEGLRMALALKPDLIILDINMPKKSGLELYSDISLSGGKKMFPVLVLTDRREFESMFKEIEADGFVPKPIDFTKLGQEVDRILSKGMTEKPKHKIKNILIVEDNDETLNRMAGSLVRGGFSVHCIKKIEDLPSQSIEGSLDLVIIKLLLCDLILGLKKNSGLMREDTIISLYTEGGSDLNKEIFKKLCEKSGIKTENFLWSDSATDLLGKLKGILELS